MADETPWHLKNYKKSLVSNNRLIPVAEEMLMREQISSTRDTDHLHPSEICKKDWCPRSSWYTINKYPRDEKPFSFQTLNIFAEGHAIHDKWQSWLTKAGVLEQVEVPIHNEEYRLLGHADGIINDAKGKAILEIKSVGIGTVRVEHYELWLRYSHKEITMDEVWKQIRQPFPTHLRQIMLYMYCTGIHEGIFLYEWKASQDVKEFFVKFQPEQIEAILSGCQNVIRGLDSGIPPMRPVWIESPVSKTCKSCPYQKVCWKEENDEINNTTTAGSSGSNNGGLS